MTTDIAEFFKDSDIKISDKDLIYLETIVLKKIMLMENHNTLKNAFNCEWNSEAIAKMRQFFINPELYGVMNLGHSAPETFTITTIKSDKYHYEGLVLGRNNGFGAAYAETDVHCATKMTITYLNAYHGPKTAKIILELNKDLSNSKNLFGTWKTEENNPNISEALNSADSINEDSRNNILIKNFSGTVYIEKNTQNFVDARVYHPVRLSVIINTYKSNLLMLKEQLERTK